MVVKEEDLLEFIKRLPDLSSNPATAHLLMLAARSRLIKAQTGEKVKDLLLAREVLYSKPAWREHYFNAAYNLALLQADGRYTYTTEEGKAVKLPSEGLAIYATLSPRNVALAVAETMKVNADLLYRRAETSEIARQSSIFFGELRKRKAERHFVTLDIEVMEQEFLKLVLDRVSSFPIFMVTETSRGHHILLDLSKPSDAAGFHGGLAERLASELSRRGDQTIMEIKSDSQEPVPGTIYRRVDGSLHYVRILQ